MLFSNSSKNGHDPFFFPDQTFFKQQDFHLPISFFPFPSPFEVDDDLLLQSHQLMTTNSGNATATAETATMVNSEQKKNPRKRLSKKDRHSKIRTARGLRDRRMRLSLPVARQFFGLQDMLGVDKGSKTVEWLLVQARPEIIKLAKERNYNLDRAKSVSSSNSECDMVSGIDEVGAGDENDKKLKKMHSGKEKKRIRQPRITMAKESREKARARARARTMEKMQIRDSAPFDHDANYTNFQDLSKRTSWSSPFETGEESAGTQSYNVNPAMEVPPPPQQLAEVEKPISSQFGTSEGMIDYQNSLEIMGKWSPSASTFNYLHQTETLLQEQHQFADSQLFG